MSVRFWNLFANRYARQAIADPEAYEIKLNATRALLTPESRVLEFGCGTGTTALSHAPHIATIRGVDSSPRMVEIATGKAKEQGVSNASFVVGTLLDIDDGPFDLVLGLNILHLIDDLGTTLRKVPRAPSTGWLLGGQHGLHSGGLGAVAAAHSFGPRAPSPGQLLR